MENQNPYESPQGDLLVDDGSCGEINFFSPNCRIGRLRYLSHYMLLLFPVTLAAIVGGMFFGVGLPRGVQYFFALIGLTYLFVLYMSFILAIQRLHDLGKSGWFCLLAFVPVANIILGGILLCAPGTEGINAYGKRPPPNNTWNKVLGITLPAIFALGLISALIASNV